jgi:hypothetical protein
MRIAAGSLSVLLGMGFGLPCLVGIIHLRRTGEVWTFMGFPTYGDGPFQRVGIPTSTGLLIAFLGVCLVEVAAGVMIHGSSDAAVAPG